MKGTPTPLGYDIMTDQVYGNEQFLRNALDYLLDDNNLINLRNRTIETRLLDRRRIMDERTYWQWFNLLVPMIFVGIFAGGFYFFRNRKFK